MNTPNPYLPPGAPVEDPAPATPPDTAPPLWNPNAAASWSLLFTPVFGAWLHMKNWQALGQPEKAEASWRWVQASAAILVVMIVLSATVLDDRVGELLARAGGFALLLGWYYTAARPQAALVLGRYGKTYPRRGWAKPLLIALAGWVATVVALSVVFGLIAAARGEV